MNLEPELQLAYIDEDTVYKVEKVIKKKKKTTNKTEVLDKWKGWPDKFNSWIDEKDFKNINSGSDIG